jgi:asparagine synthetase A
VCVVGSEKRVGNVYSKATSFVDYVWRALRRLELDESKVSDGRYHNIRAFWEQTWEYSSEQHILGGNPTLLLWTPGKQPIMDLG